MRLEADRRRKYVEQFRQRCAEWQAGRLEVAALTAEAAAALDAYSRETLRAIDISSDAGADQYHDGISSVATALRDQIDDASTRHAVAQVLQERVLRAEVRFRDAQRPRLTKTQGR